MTTAYISLGANLQQPQLQVDSAIARIKHLPRTTFITCSPWYGSSAVGPGNQPDYINGVCAINTTLPPRELLSALQEIENHHQRVRTVRWGARTLDLDILLYGDKISNHPALTLPHPRMTERNFVLIPLADIAPGLSLPDGRTVSNLASTCCTETIWPL